MQPVSRVRYVRNACLVCIVLVSVNTAWGFGPNGHRAVAEIADQHLTATTRTAVNKILNGELLVGVSTWADEQRSAVRPSKRFWENTRPWHYINVPQGQRYTGPVNIADCPEQYRDLVNFRGNVYSVIRCFTDVLSNPLAAAKYRQFALKFLVHMVGDLHQPMHTGYAEDRGGNRINLKLFGRRSNLHAVWDSGVIEHQQLAFGDLARIELSKVTQQDRQRWRTADPHAWLMESFAPVRKGQATLRETFYQLHLRTCTGGSKSLPNCEYKFTYQAVPMINRQLVKAGLRLAALLNSIYDPNHQAR